MKSLCLIVLFSLTTILGHEITSYDFNVKIDVKEKQIHVDGFTNIDFKDKDSLNLVLWKNATIKEISSKGEELKYNFDTSSGSPIMYIKEGRSLTVYRADNGKNMQAVKFIYDLDLNELNGWAVSFTEDWIKINFYSGWFPVNGVFISKFKIYIDENYIVTGSGVIEKKDGYWEMIQPWSSFDNVIIASKKLKSKILKDNDVHIQTVYSNGDFSDADADTLLKESKYALGLFENYFGMKDSTYLKFVIAPFERGGGYSRKNFICMRTLRFNRYTATKGIAHEIAHFWWLNAQTSSWEDWLNEAFAEYSMLLYIRERFGLEAFQKEIEDYKSRTQNLPPIWGIERNSNEAYSVLYEKGSVILSGLEEKIGKDKFLDFLKNVSRNKIKITNDFLALMEDKLSEDTRNWFESRLKQ